MKKKVLVFHPAMAPYRIDLWNTLNDRYDLKLYFLFDNLSDHKFNQDRLRSLLNFTPGYLTTGVNFDKRYFRIGYKSVIRRFNPDTVITSEYSQTTWFVYLIKKFFNLNFQLLTICDDNLEIALNCSGLRLKSRNFLVKRLDGLIVTNSEIANWYNRSFVLKNKCIVLPIVAREDKFKKRLASAIPLSNQIIEKNRLAGKKVVFFVGRLVRMKGLSYLIQAFSECLRTYEAITLVIIGEGDQKKHLIKLIHHLNIEKSVIFPGRFEGEVLDAWYNVGQIFVLPSIYEPFGAVVNEALLAGAYVLCSNKAGASSLIKPGDNGDVFAPEEVSQLSIKIIRYLEHVGAVRRLNRPRSSLMIHEYETLMSELYEAI